MTNLTPPNKNNLYEWASNTYRYLHRKELNVSREVAPEPIFLAHRLLADLPSAAEDGVLLFDVEQGVPLYSYAGAWKRWTATATWDEILDKPDTFPPSPHTHTESQITDLDRVRWKNLWVQTEYVHNDMVRDSSWLMIANTTTTDRAAPQLTGNPIYDMPDQPTWSTSSHNGVVRFGREYDPLVPIEVTQYEVWVPEFTPDTTYRVIIYSHPVGQPDNIVSRQIPNVLLYENAWTIVAADREIMAPGITFGIVVDALNSGSSTVITGGWTRGANSNTAAPANQAWNTSNSKTVLRVDFTDLDGTDRQTELLGVTAGSVVTISDSLNSSLSVTWTILSAGINSGTYVLFDNVVYDGAGAGGEPQVGNTTTVTIDVPVPLATEYVNIPGGNPSATSRGVLEFDGVPVGGSEANAYGVRILAEEYLVSEDWDIAGFVGLTGGSGSGGTDPSGEYLPLAGGKLTGPLRIEPDPDDGYDQAALWVTTEFTPDSQVGIKFAVGDAVEDQRWSLTYTAPDNPSPESGFAIARHDETGAFINSPLVMFDDDRPSQIRTDLRVYDNSSGTGQLSLGFSQATSLWDSDFGWSQLRFNTDGNNTTFAGNSGVFGISAGSGNENTEKLYALSLGDTTAGGLPSSLNYYVFDTTAVYDNMVDRAVITKDVLDPLLGGGTSDLYVAKTGDTMTGTLVINKTTAGTLDWASLWLSSSGSGSVGETSLKFAIGQARADQRWGIVFEEDSSLGANALGFTKYDVNGNFDFVPIYFLWDTDSVNIRGALYVDDTGNTNGGGIVRSARAAQGTYVQLQPDEGTRPAIEFNSPDYGVFKLLNSNSNDHSYLFKNSSGTTIAGVSTSASNAANTWTLLTRQAGDARYATSSDVSGKVDINHACVRADVSNFSLHMQPEEAGGFSILSFGDVGTDSQARRLTFEYDVELGTLFWNQRGSTGGYIRTPLRLYSDGEVIIPNLSASRIAVGPLVFEHNDTANTVEIRTTSGVAALTIDEDGKVTIPNLKRH